ncbi:class I SAM-dependent methyltransferase [Pajaroellobacter abortibovis]|uniref:class I SAM-dependent methyltransferase n=1 Tax=Pajaroellobacter abortibovis TaxID=1882918 RepID=UPI001FE26877|nr:methyltransferase domain-containing protein [Pajaroellobacter abortibovis]
MISNPLVPFSQREAIEKYYDQFSAAYDQKRRPFMPEGYHAFLDDREIDLIRRYGEGKEILECGCGTGLLLEKIRLFAKQARGLDISSGMLRKAEERGLSVSKGSITAIPFKDESFDLTCSFKTLPHVPEIGRALAEMARVTRSGGVVLAEFYNLMSLRTLLKKVGPARSVAHMTRENGVYTRFDGPWRIFRFLPPTLHLEAFHGIRILAPVAGAFRIPGVKTLLEWGERTLADTKASLLGGFLVAILRKKSDSLYNR